jgi:hypothetical protein
MAPRFGPALTGDLRYGAKALLWVRVRPADLCSLPDLKLADIERGR